MRGICWRGAQIVLALLYIVLLGLDSVWTIGLVVACIALAQAPLTPTSDLLTTDAVRERPKPELRAHPALGISRLPAVQ